MSNSTDLFDHQSQSSLQKPLAERCRPKTLKEIIGHYKYLSNDAPLAKQIAAGQIPSLILWGPPGVGKTTLGRVIGLELKTTLHEISAVSAGVKEVKEIITRARNNFSMYGKATLAFIDEIHRFNKTQQDALLHATEQGIITLIGATTENPSFEVNAALLSRCTVIKLEMLEKDDLIHVIENAIQKDILLKEYEVKIESMDALLLHGSGDARKTLNLLESAFVMAGKENKKVLIDNEIIEKAAAGKALGYDKKSDYHYDTISAFIKSVRGSDPDAAVYWLARMLDAGEDPLFIARRLVILSSEDIGNAEPYALSLANAGFESVKKIGMPEARIILSQVTTYLASVPKSNAAYLAIDAALTEIKQSGVQPVPLHLRNAPTKLMKDLDYGSGYKYAHDHPNHFADQQYLPDKLAHKIFYNPSEMGREKKIKEYLKWLWPGKRSKE
ncbi:MAG: replication-associated recombination protein A [Calditrichaeota bacterium]|nr:MAG: replication-associated recombination protein A [Calditrichota bacterium]MBL1205981.1 replication-associated recombination protein A [Calditrichota bacterium]NOG45809.1 replication-associated recombination protein A [Calditrichota bacterium]